MCGGLIGGVFNFLEATDVAPAMANLNAAKGRARDASNAKNAAASDLARFSAALGNQKKLDAAGQAYATISENLFRGLDTSSMNRTEAGLVLSERMGAAVASAAAAGIGGSSVEIYNKTMETSADLQTNLADRNVTSAIYIAQQQRGQVLKDAVASFNNDAYVANMDYSYMGKTKPPSVLGELVTLGVAAGLTAAGAPQAGEAVLRARTASMQAQYGDAKGAQQSMDQALTAFKGGIGEIKGWFNQSNSGSFSFDSNTSNLNDVGSFMDNGISFG